jgi:glycosyltransferase involved in cell wall biosynthesis
LVLTGTQAAAGELVHYLKLAPERVRVVPYGTGPAVPADEGALGRFGLSGRSYVLWVGSLEPRKGVGTLVEAVARLPAAKRPLLVLAGYQGWKVPPPSGEGVRRLGEVTDAELQALYAGATAFCFPSLHEGFGLPVLEAMAAGVPVIASDIPAVREVAGDAALLAPPGEAAKWAEAIEAAVSMDALRREALVEGGRQRAARFTWRATAEQTLEVYRQLV